MRSSSGSAADIQCPLDYSFNLKLSVPQYEGELMVSLTLEIYHSLPPATITGKYEYERTVLLRII